MSGRDLRSSFAESPPENYQRYFVPAIGAPVAQDLVKAAGLRPGERVLDVACGTGVVTRLASELVGQDGAVDGLDVNPGMLAVARAVTPAEMDITWQEASAESMPYPDKTFDVVLCQMGLQFVPDQAAAVAEMQRVLAPGGRLVLNAPGPTPPPFAMMAEALTKHVAPQAEEFVTQVFSLHDTGEIEGLVTGAGLQDVSIDTRVMSLTLPPPDEFFWQYVHSTPLIMLAASATEKGLAQAEQDVVEKWEPFVEDDALHVPVRMVTATARRG